MFYGKNRLRRFGLTRRSMCFRSRLVNTNRPGTKRNAIEAQWLAVLGTACLAFACHSTDAPGTSLPTIDGGGANFCDLPGSVQFKGGHAVQVAGADGSRLAFLHLPDGFCAHYFGNVGNARQLRFAPGGELFVASPVTGTTGGGPNGKQSILVLPDDDKDGVADGAQVFLSGLPSTQGLLFANSALYYQDDTKIMRVAYRAGDRSPTAASELVTTMSGYHSSLHWPKPMDQADDGTIYVGNGGDQGEPCVEPHPFHGGILTLDGNPGGTEVARGFRNPIAVRCEKGKNLCFAIELARDYSAGLEGREKLMPIHAGDDWGFPCCATKDTPFPDVIPTPDCKGIASENASFVIGDTPFGLDFEPGIWPAPFTGSVFVTLHGVAGGWQGARLVAIAVDPATGLPEPGDDLQGVVNGALTDFATGWDDQTRSHGRPAAVTFSVDGRLFLSNDNNGDIIWIAPLDLAR